MRYIVFIFCCLMISNSNAQEELSKNKSAGDFTLGLRSTSSFFDNTNSGLPGIGTGGDFRIRLSDRVNTDWFADYILSTSDYLKRNDFHIGWSVLFYPFNFQNRGFKPYVLAGHCFDYSEYVDLKSFNHNANRWSSAVQGGIGTHYYFTPRFDMIFQAQYMMHLGTHLEADIINNEVEFSEDKGALSEGHLLVTVGFNYKIGKLWGRK